MNKSISISNPDQLVSLIVEPYAGPKIGGTLNLSIFTSANYIDISDNGIKDFGVLPGNLETFNCSKNKISNIPSTFSVSNKLLNIDLHNNSLTELDIERILSAFIDKDVSGITPQPIIDISKFGNAVPNTVSLGYITTLENNGWNVKYNPGEYVLSTDVVSVSEGQSITISLDRTISEIADGTTVPYTITGIQADDIVEPLTGNFTVNNNTASLTFNIESDIGVDKYAEGETFTMTLDSPNAVTSIDIPIVDTTPEPYALTATTSEIEGQSFNITISTTVGTTVSDGTTVPYTITGIQANDIAEALTGNFTLTSNTDTITINLEANSPIDENETMTIKLDDYPTSASIRIYDV
jgi:hypothetical protein